MGTAMKLLALLLFASAVGLSLSRPSPDWQDYRQDLAWGQQPLPRYSSAYPHFYPTDVEPSSRDLDIGFTIDRHDDEDVERLDSYSAGGPIRSGYVAREGNRLQFPGDVHIGVLADGPASSGWSRRGDDGYPGVMTRPLGHKDAEIKLRNDRGYQLSLHVPPSSGGDQPGVLKIDMKATLFKPIYY